MRRQRTGCSIPNIRSITYRRRRRHARGSVPYLRSRTRRRRHARLGLRIPNLWWSTKGWRRIYTRLRLRIPDQGSSTSTPCADIWRTVSASVSRKVCRHRSLYPDRLRIRRIVDTDISHRIRTPVPRRLKTRICSVGRIQLNPSIIF